MPGQPEGTSCPFPPCCLFWFKLARLALDLLYVCFHRGLLRAAASSMRCTGTKCSNCPQLLVRVWVGACVQLLWSEPHAALNRCLNSHIETSRHSKPGYELQPGPALQQHAGALDRGRRTPSILRPYLTISLGADSYQRPGCFRKVSHSIRQRSSTL